MQTITQKPIVLSHVNITDTHVKVTSEECSTVFADTYLVQESVSELLPQIKRITKLAREAKVTIKKAAALTKSLKAAAEDVSACNEKYLSLFKQYKSIWDKKVVTGIFTGYRDDEEIQRAIKLSGQMQVMLYRNAVLGQMLSIASRLNDLELRLNRNTDTLVSVSLPSYD